MASKYPMGRIYDWRMTEQVLAEARHPLLRAALPPEARGSGAGQLVLGHKMVDEIIGDHKKLHVSQTVGDCSSQGGVKSTDYMRCAEIKAGEREEFVAPIASEPTYAYGRVEISRGYFGKGDGCSGAAIVKGLQKGGTLLRQVYKTPKATYDFRRYDGALARKWAMPKAGVPDDLEPTMREHPVRDFSLVTDYESFRDAIWNGYFGFVSSDQGFSDKRDAEGFAKPSGTWSHIMTVIGFDDNPRRPAVLIDNSWPLGWISGPWAAGREGPAGSFWVDADVFEKRMLKPDADSYVVSGYDGYPARELFEMI